MLQASADTSIQALDKIKIVSSRTRAPDSLSIRRVEEAVGEVDDVNIAYLLQPGVAHVPEAGSQIMVRGESPYDNLFLLRDVPLLSIGHFGGSTFADRSAIPAAAPLTMRFIDDRLAGCYSGASGSITTVDPGIIMPDSNVVARPQLLINYGNIGQDLSFAAPLRKNRDHYQFTLRVADADQIDAIAYLNYRSTIQAGHVLPKLYDDAQFLGEQRIGSMRFRELAWLSIDKYATPTATQFPWGALALSMGDSADSWHATIGGSHQYSYDGKRIGPFLPIKELQRDGLTMTVQLRQFRLGAATISSNVFIEHAQWNGFVHKNESQETNTSSNMSNPARPSLGIPSATMSDTAIEPAYSIPSPDIVRQGISGMGALHFGYENALSFARYGVDVNGGGFFCGNRIFIDPGIWLRYPLEQGSIQLDAGIVSSQPDIRGLPSGNYASALIHTYSGSVSMNKTVSPWLFTSLVGYFKVKDPVPLLSDDVSDPTWNSRQNGRLLAYGTALRLDAKLGSSFSITSTQSVGSSMVLNNGKRDVYPWDIPWSNTTALSKGFLDDRLTAHCIGTFSAGLPYRSPVEEGNAIFWSNPWRRMPTYKCIDFKLQYCQPIKHHRFLKQLDGYILIDNIVDAGSFINPQWSGGFNAREYYWDAQLAPHQISLKPFGGYLGMRTWFRL